MPQRLGSTSDLLLEIKFDPSFGLERLRELVSEDKIKELSKIESFDELDKIIKNDFFTKALSIVEKYNSEINESTIKHIDEKFKDEEAVKIYKISNYLSIDRDKDLIVLNHYVDGEGDTKSVLSEIKDYNYELIKSASLRSFMLELNNLLKEYSLVLEECNIKSNLTCSVIDY